MHDDSGSMADQAKDLAAARLAVEVGWRQVASNQQTLEGMRARSMALLSVMVVAASIIAGTSINNQPNASSQSEASLSGLAWAGIVLFAVYVLVTTATVIHVAAPTRLLASDLLLMLGVVRHLASTTHVYENYVHDLTEQLDKWHSTVKWRARSLTIGLCVAPLGVAGFVLLWANGT